jgi:GTP-binding protein Era
MNTQDVFHAGHVAIIGRPNVGKSTLVNALVGAKVSITSSRPQTTRHRLLGIASFDHGQLLLVDTPGIHRDQGKATASAMHRWMNRAARGALEGVDAAVLVIEAGRWDEGDALAYDALKSAGVPVVLAVNQVDKFKDKTALLPFLGEVSSDREFAAVHPISALKRRGLEPLVTTLLALLPFLSEVNNGRAFAAVHPISALKRKGLEPLVDTLMQLMPEQPALYSPDEITDKSQRFLAGELVREQLMRQLGAELPYAATVEIESFVEEPIRNPGTSTATHLLRIGAVIWVERDGQKAIVIGKNGARLREVGTRAREQMERLYGARVFLETWVRVREGWSDDEAALRTLGYHD